MMGGICRNLTVSNAIGLALMLCFLLVRPDVSLGAALLHLSLHIDQDVHT